MTYTYNGTQRGEADPWTEPERTTPKPKQAKPKPPKPARTFMPCGTKAAHKRHLAHGETPCQPCKDAKANYDRDWRAGRIGPRRAA